MADENTKPTDEKDKGDVEGHHLFVAPPDEETEEESRAEKGEGEATTSKGTRTS